MKKIIRKIGDSVGIIFNKEECKIHNINTNKIFNIDIKEVKIK